MGFPWRSYAQSIQAEAFKYIIIAVMGTLFVLVFFPLFFRHHLSNPLNSLLNGVKQADKGQLDLKLPVYFEDEIGAITRSFNQLMASLRLSNQSRDEYYEKLEDANSEMERRVEDRTRELSEANRELVIARDEAGRSAVLEERHRLARDLHDAISQSLYGVMLFARASRDAQEAADWGKLQDGLKEIEDNSLQALKEMRLLLYQLRPMMTEHDSLQVALDRRFGQVERRMGITATADLESDLDLTREVEQSIYMIATEALNNSLKHSNSKAVHMRLGRLNGGVQLLIKDSGRGFDISRPTAGMGINNMRERAAILGGSLEISSEEGGGTQICLNVPRPNK
jgi:signal transduction histidine kinase